MLSEFMKVRRATTITEVVDIMDMLDRERSDADGLWWFFNETWRHSPAPTPVGYAWRLTVRMDGSRNLRGNHADHRRLRFLPANI